MPLKRRWRRFLPDLVQRADLAMFRRISETHHPTGDRILPRLSGAANHSRLWMGLATVIAALGGRFGRRAALRGMVSIGGASFLANIPAKLTFNRARPSLAVPVARRLARVPASTSFPSGHSASAFAFATGVTLERPSLAPLVFPAAAAVAYSRIYTGVHYPSDVLAGAAIGAGVAMATRRIWPLVPDEPAQARPAGAELESIGPDGRGVTIVVNSSAGPPKIASMADRLAAALPQAKIVEIEGGDLLLPELQKAAGEAEVLGVAGGDGSVSAAAAVANEAKKPLLIVPAGTLNNFARDLGVATFDDAVRAVADRAAVEVDLGVIDGRVFVNTASLGAYVDLVDAREQMEGLIGKWPALAVALVRILRRGAPIEIEIDGEPARIWMAFFGNCSYMPAGFAPARRSRLDDGLLDVRVVDATHPFSRTRLVWAVLTGTLAHCSVYRAALTDGPIRVRSRRGALSHSRDGETFEGSQEFEIEKAAGRLKVLVPAERTTLAGH